MAILSSPPLLPSLSLLPIVLMILHHLSQVLVAQFQHRLFPPLRNRRVCLLIAHPDDEAMFFAPTLLGLTAEAASVRVGEGGGGGGREEEEKKKELGERRAGAGREEMRTAQRTGSGNGMGNSVRILCLSSGDADGLGETRKNELVRSGMWLGLARREDITVIEDASFPDSMTTDWDPQLISKALHRALVRDPSNAATPVTPSIDILITFDRHGVSSHPNHRSLYHGARAFLQNLQRDAPDAKCPVSLYTLTSTSLLRKYASAVDSLVTLLLMLASRNSRAGEDPPLALLYANSEQETKKARLAMTQAHKSQMRWFRYGWIGLSRYMVVNDLKRDAS